MAAKIQIIRSVDYLDVTDSGEINFPESRDRLKQIAQKDTPSDWDVLFDFRRTQWVISTDEIFDLVEVFLDNRNSFREKVALLLLPGVNFDREEFNELCAKYEPIPVRTFTNYEDAIHWFYQG